MEWPEWWEWDLAFTAHLEDRMKVRLFSEVDLRAMLHDATRLEPSARPGRWIVYTRFAGRPWAVVVEPDSDEQQLYVVTAYGRETER